jgi:WD40 repeat protein
MESHVESKIESHVETHQETVVESHQESHVETRQESHVETHQESHVETHQESHVETHQESHVETHHESHVETHQESHVETHQESHVETHQESHVETHQESHVETHQESHMETHQESHVETKIESHVEMNVESKKEEVKSDETPKAAVMRSPKKKQKRKKKTVKKMVEGEEVEVEEEESEEEEEAAMDENEYYPDNYSDKRLPDSDIPKKFCKFNGIYGMESYKRFNIHLIEPHVIIYANGNTYEFYDMQEKTRKTLFGKDTDGIGSIAVHPSRKFFAIAEKGTNPNIYIYDYPDLRLYRICKNGTEKAYSHVEFSVNGDKLASVGSAPDYTITVWNWKLQRVILKSKAFSQEVYRVSFSPYTDGVLVTSGMGHIKFWKMANTFTGLKLKGELGKYGKLELSDVTGFRELPDGKVVSGTEYGTMILWEGRNIKAHLVQDHSDMTPLHKGFLEVIILEKDEFITAGEDGYIKFWNFFDVDSAEFSDEKMEVAIKPNREIFVSHADGTPAHINQMTREGDRWILGDARGKIWEINLETEEKFEIMKYHSGGIADLGVCEHKNVAVTCGSDGVLK